MNLFTKAIREQLIKNHKKDEGSKSSLAYVKLFNPTGKGTWYLSELDPETNVAYGLCEIFEKEPTDIVWAANAAVLASAVGFTN